MTKCWRDPRWNNVWNNWKDIPVEFRAALVWSFLTTGPRTKHEYPKIFMAMEQWKFSRHAVFLELEIDWMYGNLRVLCDRIEDIDIFRGLSLFFGGKAGNAKSIRDRFTRSKFNLKAMEMLDLVKKEQRDFQETWAWMDAWFLRRKQATKPPPLLTCLAKESERTWHQARVLAKNLDPLALKGPVSSKDAPRIHLGRSFPIDVAGQEIQKTVRSVEGLHGPAMIWGYVLHTPEPEIPYDPFPVHVSTWDPDFNRRWLNRPILHQADAFIGGSEDGLADLPLELGLAVDQLKKPNRPDSPMAHLVMA